MFVLRCSVMSNSLPPHGLQPSRLLGPWGFSGRNRGVGCHFSPPGDLPGPEIKLVSLESPALAGRFFTTRATCMAKQNLWDRFLDTRVLSPRLLASCIKQPFLSIHACLSQLSLSLVTTSANLLSSAARWWQLSTRRPRARDNTILLIWKGLQNGSL